jgi:hypothetical protein
MCSPLTLKLEPARPAQQDCSTAQQDCSMRAWLAVTSWMYDCMAACPSASQPCSPAKRRWRRSTSTPPHGTRLSTCNTAEYMPILRAVHLESTRLQT